MDNGIIWLVFMLLVTIFINVSIRLILKGISEQLNKILQETKNIVEIHNENEKFLNLLLVNYTTKEKKC